jgi:hypothetical protein
MDNIFEMDTSSSSSPHQTRDVEEYDPVRPEMFPVEKWSRAPAMEQWSRAPMESSSSMPPQPKAENGSMKRKAPLYKKSEKEAKQYIERKRKQDESTSRHGKKPEKKVIRPVKKLDSFSAVSLGKRSTLNFSVCNHCLIRSQAKLSFMHGTEGTVYLTVVLCPKCIEINSKLGNVEFS